MISYTLTFTSTRLLQRSKNYFIEYKNQAFPNNSHIHLRACDAASSYHCPSPITGYNLSKWDCILNYCYDCPRTNAPYLKSPEQLHSLFPATLHKIKLHIFQNTSKFSIHGLRPFKYKNMCELCDNILDKDNKGILMSNKCFVIHEEVIDVFHKKLHFHNRKLLFNLAHVRVLGRMECRKTKNYCFHANE